MLSLIMENVALAGPGEGSRLSWRGWTGEGKHLRRREAPSVVHSLSSTKATQSGQKQALRKVTLVTCASVDCRRYHRKKSDG